jgi:hypothetical protein
MVILMLNHNFITSIEVTVKAGIASLLEVPRNSGLIQVVSASPNAPSGTCTLTQTCDTDDAYAISRILSQGARFLPTLVGITRLAISSTSDWTGHFSFYSIPLAKTFQSSVFAYLTYGERQPTIDDRANSYNYTFQEPLLYQVILNKPDLQTTTEMYGHFLGSGLIQNTSFSGALTIPMFLRKEDIQSVISLVPSTPISARFTGSVQHESEDGQSITGDASLMNNIQAILISGTK